MPAVHKIFSDAEGARRHLGLADYLSGNADIDKIIMAGPQENLSVICAGAKTTQPGELLGADSFVTLIKTLEDKFDRVIIDSAPVNAVSDTLRITPLAHYVCLVVRAAKTPKKRPREKLIENVEESLRVYPEQIHSNSAFISTLRLWGFRRQGSRIPKRARPDMKSLRKFSKRA
jgi:Mrp family chromosome partitioning ATPase